jgi:hypothetical protein
MRRLIVAKFNPLSLGIIVVLLAAAVRLAWAAPAYVWAYQQPSSFQTTLSTDRREYKLGQPILVTIQQKNTSQNVLLYVRTVATLDYDVFVSTGSSTMPSAPVAPTAWGRNNQRPS